MKDEITKRVVERVKGRYHKDCCVNRVSELAIARLYPLDSEGREQRSKRERQRTERARKDTTILVAFIDRSVLCTESRTQQMNNNK